MLTKLFMLALSFFWVPSNISAQIKLSGEIAGLGKDETVELYDREKDELINSGVVKNERFAMQLHSLPYKKYLLYFKNAKAGIIVWVEGSNIHIKGQLSDLTVDPLKDSKEFLRPFHISGGPTQRVEDIFYKDLTEGLLLLDTLLHPFEYIYSLQPAFNDFASVQRRADSIKQLIIKKKTDYIKTRPQSLFSSYLLISFFPGNQLTAQQFNDLFIQFTPSNKQSYYGRIINTILKDGYSPIQKGVHFKDIMLKDSNNITRNLSSLKGKPVILTFWSTTCPAAILNNKILLSLYNKFNKSGLEIFAVSIDRNAGKWKQAVKNEGLSWINLIDENGFNSITALKYGIRSIPRNFLIDSKGVIIDADLEIDSNEIEGRIKELLLQ